MLKVTNNASSMLANSITSSQTTIAVSSGDEGEFPSPGTGDWFPAVIVDSANNREIVKVTARSGVTLTVVRGQEGTTAQAFDAGARIDLRPTAAMIDELNFTTADEKSSIVDNDAFALKDSAVDGTPPKTTKWSTIKSALKTYLDALYLGKTAKAADSAKLNGQAASFYTAATALATLISDLASTTTGKGASTVGVEAIAGVTGSTVQSVLVSLKTLIAAIPAPTEPDYGAGNAALAYGAVGTYVFGYRADVVAAGGNYAGSSIYPASASPTSAPAEDGSTAVGIAPMWGGSALSGTWKAMGRNGNTTRKWTMTLFLRIA